MSWLSPDEPNGKIVAYNIIIDGVTIHTNLSYTSAYVVDGLRPYTIYTLKVRTILRAIVQQAKPNWTSSGFVGVLDLVTG